MEIELKYSLTNKTEADSLWTGEFLKDYKDENTKEKKAFHAIYYDTESFDLYENNMAYRIRQEGTKMVAGIKWNGKNIGPLHKREELTVNLGDSGSFLEPDPRVFCQSDIGEMLMEIVGDKKLHGIMEMKIERRSIKLDSDNAIFEMSIDEGVISAGGNSTSVCELEIELYSGPDEAIDEMAAIIKEKKGYEPENLSKYARGLKLLGKKVD